MFTELSPRPVKPSIAKLETPIALKSFVQDSILAPMPPEPCIRITSGSRPLPCAMRSSPVMVTGLPSVAPLKNCWSDSVSEG